MATYLKTKFPWILLFGFCCGLFGHYVGQYGWVKTAEAAKEPVEVKLLLCDDVVNYWSKRYAYCKAKEQIDCMDMVMAHLSSIFSGCR